MLNEEITKYSELTGEDGWKTPIMKIGAYLDGYEKGLEQAKRIEKENEELKEKIKKLESDLSWSRDNNQMGRW